MVRLAMYEAHDPHVAHVWRALEAAASRSYFLTWAWVENWLACVPREHAPALVVVEDAAGRALAACFVGKRRTRRHGIARTARYLNTTGCERCDDLCIEHNGVLRAADAPGLAALVESLPDDWDELFVPAIDRDELGSLAPLAGRFDVRVVRELATPFVDLALVRGAGDYAAVLDPGTRVQVHRTQAALGALTLEVAEDERTALALHDELLAMPDRRGSAFGDPWYTQLHGRLVATRLRHGEIALYRVRAGGRTLGVLYGFIHAGRIAIYQAGFARSADPHVKPCFATHLAAVEHSARAGLATYDLLADPARTKHALATGESRQLWLRVQRQLARFTLEDRLGGIRHAISSWRHRSARPAGRPSRRRAAGVPSRA